MVPTIKRVSKDPDGISDIRRFVGDYVEQKTFLKMTSDRFETMKRHLRTFIEKHGEADDKGNLWVKMEGMSDCKLERRTSRKFNEAKAGAWLAKNKLLEECTTTETVSFVDESLVAAAAYSKQIPEKIFKGFYEETETFAMTRP